MVFNAFSVLGIPTRDTQNTSDLGTGVPKTRGYPNHCDSATAFGRGYTVPVIPNKRFLGFTCPALAHVGRYLMYLLSTLL